MKVVKQICRFNDTLIYILIAIVVLLVNHLCSVTDAKPFNTPYAALLPFTCPSIFWAAGQGLVTTDIEKIPDLVAFIYREKETFDINLIPKDCNWESISSTAVLTHRYYMYFIGIIIWIFGVSIASLIKAAIIIRLVSSLLLYCILRKGLSRASAMIITLLVCTSPAMITLDMTPRDMSKVPFIYAIVCIIVHLFLKKITLKQYLAFSGILGVLLGVGYGFRPDLIICLPPALFSLIFTPRDYSRVLFRNRIVAVVLMVTTMFPFVWPIFKAAAREGNQQTSAHTFLVGMSPGIEKKMNFGEASYNVFPFSFSGEAAVYSVVNTYARRTGNMESMVNVHCSEYQRFLGNRNAELLLDPYFFYNGPVYAQVGRIVLRDLISIFPADFVARAWCGVATAFQGPLYYSSALLQTGDTCPLWKKWLLELHNVLSILISKYGLIIVTSSLVFLAGANLRLAVFFTGLFLWFFGYPSVQFEYRHSFFLIFVPFWAVGLGVEQFARFVYNALKSSSKVGRGRITSFFRNIFVFVASMIFIYIFPLVLLRTWQSYQLNQYINTLCNAQFRPIKGVIELNGDNLRLIPSETLQGLQKSSELPPGETAWEYVALVFDTHGYDVPVHILYDEKRFLNDFSQTVLIQGVSNGTPGRVTLFFPIYELDTTYSLDMLPEFLRTFPALAERINDDRPIYEQDWWRRGKFLGISFPEMYLPLFRGFFTVRNIEDVQLLPIIQVPDDRQFLHPYKTGPWERRIRSWLSDRFLSKQPLSVSPLNNDCWELDESLVYHVPSPIFTRPLMEEKGADDYIDKWLNYVEYLPELASAAALDLATIGTVWRNEGRITDAISVYQAARQLMPNQALYPVRLGQLLELLGDKDNALLQYMHALELQDLLPQTAERADRLFVERGNLHRQREFWRMVFEKHPNSWFVGMRLGGLLEQAGEYHNAAEVYDHVHKVFPEHPDTRLALARCLGMIGDHKESIHLIEEILKTHGDYLDLAISHLELISHHLSEQGNHEAAIEVLLVLTPLKPEDSSVLIWLGDEQYRGGFLTAASESYQKALALIEPSDMSRITVIQEKLKSIASHAMNNEPH